MTYFEIFSNVSSPWENVFPIIKDPLILEGAKNGIRPDVSAISTFYECGQSNIVCAMIKIDLEVLDERCRDSTQCYRGRQFILTSQSYESLLSSCCGKVRIWEE